MSASPFAPLVARLPFLAAGTVVDVVRDDAANRGWVVARSATVVDDSLLWGQTLIAFAGGLGRVAVDRRWVLPVA